MSDDKVFTVSIDKTQREEMDRFVKEVDRLFTLNPKKECTPQVEPPPPPVRKKKSFSEIKQSLLSTILGQEEVINDVVKKLMRREFSLSTDRMNPTSFFWAGPTGVGKTETALQLGKLLSMPLVRLDMSEYMESHNVSRLIGSPPGYVGFAQPGVLQECNEQACILLVDEIEKAHPKVFNMFLQILDYGILTDGQNKQIDFSNCIIIMTSNVGAREMNERKIGFLEETSLDKKSTVSEAMKLLFAPEFINRIGSIQIFNSLNDSTVKKIIDQKISKVVGAVLKDHSIQLDIDESLVLELVNKGFDPVMGARPIERALESLMLEPLSEFVLSEDRTLEAVSMRFTDGAVKVSSTSC